MKKNLIRALLTTAMVMSIAATTKVDAKAVTLKEFAAACGKSEAQVKADKELYSFYEFIKDDDLSEWIDGDDVAYTGTETTSTKGTATASATAGVAVGHKEMLDLINADRKENGSGSLVWSEDLEKIAYERAVEVMANFQSSEMAAAIAADDYNKIRAIGHSGMRRGTSENAIWVEFYGETAEEANADWIASAGHHRNRIKAGWTKYACASYTDSVTGTEVWVEVFADNSFKGASSFDYMRYAKDYPDLAAAFGQDKNALYKHYRTYGKIEGRKAYYTDGTLIK